MPWQQKLFRYFAQSLKDARGERLRFDLVGRVIDGIGDDAELRSRFAALETEDEVGRAFLDLYARELGARD